VEVSATAFTPPKFFAVLFESDFRAVFGSNDNPLVFDDLVAGVANTATVLEWSDKHPRQFSAYF